MAMKNYPEEFKADAVALYESTPGATIKGIARDLGVSRETLRLWVRRAAEERGQVAAARSPRASAAEPAESPVRSGGRVGQLELSSERRAAHTDGAVGPGPQDGELLDRVVSADDPGVVIGAGARGEMSTLGLAVQISRTHA